MGKLIYVAIASLDGFIEDEAGKFDWAAPDEEVHAYVNAREREIKTHLYGRRMYDTMMVWETEPALAESSPVMREYAHIWQAADKVVYSRKIQGPSTARTRIERQFEPEAVRRLVQEAGHDVTIGGPKLAAQAFGAGLVDECNLYVVPYIAGGGKPCLPRGVALQLELLEEHRFGSGTVHLRYRTLGSGG